MNSVGLRRPTLVLWARPEFLMSIFESTSSYPVSLSLAEAASGHRASQDRPSYQPKPANRGNGPNNSPQKAQGHVPQPIVSSKPQAPKAKHSQPITGHSPAPNSVPRGLPQKAQNQAPTPQSFFSLSPTHQQPTNSGKNTANGSPKVQTTTQHAPRGGQSAKGLESPSHSHKASSHSHPAQETSIKGNKNPPKSTMNDWFLRPIKSPSPTKNVPPPAPAKASPPIPSAGSKGTGNPPFDSMNPSGSKRNSLSGSHQAAKRSPAPAEGPGTLGWLSSWLPSAGQAPVQATKKPMPNPSTGKRLESLPNGSQTRQFQTSNSSRPKGTDSGGANGPPKNGPTPNNSSTPAHDKVRPLSRQVPETSPAFNKGNNGGRNELPLIPPKKESSPANNEAHAQSRHAQAASPASTNKGNDHVALKLPSLVGDRSPGRGESTPSPPKKDSTAANNSTGNRSSNRTNMSTSSSQRNSSSGSHRESSSCATNMSTKPPAVPQGSGALGWLSSWFMPPATDISKQVQVTKKPSPVPNKAKGLLNGSQTRQSQASNSSAAKGTEIALTNVPPKRDSPTSNKVHPESRHVQETFNKGINNNVSAKASSRAEDRSLGWNETFAFLPKKDSTPANRKTSSSTSAETKGITGPNVKSATDCSPKSSGSKHLSSHSSAAYGRSLNQDQALAIVTRKQPVPSMQDILPARLSSMRCISCFSSLIISSSQFAVQ